MEFVDKKSITIDKNGREEGGGTETDGRKGKEAWS